FAHAVRELLREGADWDYLDAHASGVDELRGAVERFDLATTARLTGLAPSSISEFVEAVRRAGRIALMSGTGLTMSAAPAVAEWLMRALEVVTGSSDRVGGSFFSPGFFTQRDTTNWEPRVGGPGPGPRSRPELPSWMGMYACAAFADEVEHGFLRALVVVGGNPFVAFPDHDRVVGALEALDVVAVADVVSSDTTRYATHLLPCAGQLERGDLNMGSASAVFGQYTPALVAVGARRRKQWHLFADLAGRLGHDVLPDGLSLESCRDEDLLAAGCAAARVPFVELAAHESGVLTERGTYGWVTERVLPHGRWNVAPRSLVEQLSRLDVHTTTVYIPRRPRHRVNSTLRDLGEVRDDDAVFLHADDAAEIGAADGTVVRVASAHGSVVGPVKIDEGLRRRAVSIHHASDTLNVASLTSGAENVDPITGMVLQSGIPVTLSLVGSDDGSGPSRSTTDVAAP
ncbi:MAG: molybdopterin dinucleotide binding domain-containing protein, partial [Microbacterium sp.]